VPVPLPLSAKETPLGSGPLSDREAAGLPVETRVKVPALEVVKVALLVDVMDGAASTVSVKDCDASGLTPLVALMVIG
jgi:hypothetical protein